MSGYISFCLVSSGLFEWIIWSIVISLQSFTLVLKIWSVPSTAIIEPILDQPNLKTPLPLYTKQYNLNNELCFIPLDTRWKTEMNSIPFPIEIVIKFCQSKHFRIENLIFQWNIQTWYESAHKYTGNVQQMRMCMNRRVAHVDTLTHTDYCLRSKSNLT